MRLHDRLAHEFVEFIPDHHQLQNGTIYVSIPYATAIHKCFCGCGEEVVTPLSPTGWQLTFDGETISLSPSIGNWDLPCRSHYWIRQDRVHWAPKWSQKEINSQRTYETQKHQEHYRENELSLIRGEKQKSAWHVEIKPEQSYWTRLFKRFFKGK